MTVFQPHDCNMDLSIAHSGKDKEKLVVKITGKQSSKNGDILTMMISPYYGHIIAIRNYMFYNTGPWCQFYKTFSRLNYPKA